MPSLPRPAPHPLPIRSVLALLLPLLLLAGCTLEPPREDARTAWELHPELPDARSDQPIDAVLHVTRPAAATALATRDMAYRQSDYELRYYARNMWATEPARLIHPKLVEALERAGPFRHVVASSVDVRTRYRLESDLLRLEQDFREHGTGLVRLEMRLRLIDLREGELLGSRRFTAQSVSDNADASGGVRAANRALGSVLSDAVEWVDETMQR